jgi:autotransporter-associated beta strand protein
VFGAGAFSQSGPLGNGNLDTSIGLSTSKTYTHAYNIRGANQTINGVAFTGVSNYMGVDGSFILSGWKSTTTGGDVIGAGSGLNALLNTFNYDGSPETLTLTNLVVGKNYILTFYNKAWDNATRLQTVTSSSGSATVFDENVGGTPNANLFRYTFTATNITEWVRFAAQSSATMHFYGFSTELLSLTNTWTSGSGNWTAPNWSAGVPNGRSAQAVFPARSVQSVIRLDAPAKVGHLQFDGTRSYTLDGTNALTIWTDVGGAGVFNVVTGAHNIAVSTVLSNDLVKLGDGALAMSGIISGPRIVNVGAGTLVLSGSNIHSGGTVVNGGGTLQTAHNAAVGNAPVTINAGGLLQLTSPLSSTSVLGAGTVDLGTSILTLNQTVTNTFSGVITGAGALMKNNAGTLIFGSASSKYNGGTVINAGTIQANVGGANGDGAGQMSSLGLLSVSNTVTINNGGTLLANQNGILGQSAVLPYYSPAVIINPGGKLSGSNWITFLHNLYLNGGTLDIGTGRVDGSFNTCFGLKSSVTVGGTTPSAISRSGTGAYANVSVGNGTSGAMTTFNVADVTGSAATDLTLSTPVRNWLAVASGLRKTGLGTMVLSATNLYTGGTRLDAGTLQLGSVNALGANGNALTVNGGTLDLRGFGVSAGTLGGLGGTITDTGSALAQPTTLVASQTVDNAFAGVLADGASQKIALVKDGSAMLTLTGSNTYSGTTTINAGKLVLDGSAAAKTLTTGGVIVNSAGTLAFTPGTATALTNKTGSTVMLNGGTLAVDIASGGAADLLVADMLNVATSSTLALAGLGNLIPNTAYPVIQYSTFSGAGSLSVPNAGRLSLTVTNDTTASQIKVLTALDNAAWANTAGGAWNTDGNWAGYTPILAGEAALLGSGLTASDTLSLPVPLLLGYLTFDNAFKYTVGASGGNNLTLSTGNPQVPSLIRVLSGSHAIAENVVLSNDVSVTTAASTSLALDGALNSAFALAKYGEGELRVTASNTFSGGTALYAGTLATSNRFALGSGAVALNSGLLRLQQGLTVSNTLSSLAGSTIDLGTNILTVIQSGNSVMAGVITNTGALFKDGSGALTLAGANTFSGGVTLNNGTLNLGHAAALGSGPLLIQGGSLDNLSGATMTVANAINVNGNVTFNATDSLELAGPVTLANADRTLTLGGGSGALTASGRLAGSNANRILQTVGTGTFNLGGVWTNTTANSQGRIYIAHVGSFAILAGSRIKMGGGTGGLINLYGNVVGTIQNNAVLTMVNDTFKIGAVVDAGAGGPSILNLVPGGAFNFETGYNLLLGEGNGGVGTYALFNMTGGTLAMGSGTGLVVGGPQDSTAAFSGGTATLYNVNLAWVAGNPLLHKRAAAAHTFTVGGTADVTVTNTFVSSYSDSSAGHTAFINLLGDSSSRGVLTTVPLSGADSTNWTSTLTFDGGLLRVNATGANNGDGGGALTNFLGNVDTVKVKAGGARIDTQGKSIRISQGLSGDPASTGGGLMKLGTGSLTLAGPCSYAGETIISNGTLKVGVVNALPVNAAVVVAGGIYDLGGFTVTNGTVTLIGGTLVNGSLDAIVSVIGTNASISAALTGQAVKSGNGVLRLTGDQSAFTRATIAEGTLQLGSTNDIIVAPPSPVACYRFEDSVADVTGNGHNGTIEGTGSSFVAGRPAAGKAMNFNGSQAVAVTYASDLALNTYTVSAWVNLNAVPGTFGILGTRFNGENTFDVKVMSTKVHADIGSGGGWLNTAVDFNVVVPVGSWHMITYAVDNAAQQVRMYYDGVLTNALAFSGTPLLMKAGQTLKIGSSSTGESMNGKMDDVYIYGSALSADQVKALYQEGGAAQSLVNQLATNATLTVATGAIVDLNGHTQTLGGLSGSGVVSNGTLTVVGTTAPGGTNLIGTLTLATTTTLSGTLLIDVKTDSTCDVLQVQGSLSLVDLDLQIQDMGQLSAGAAYVIARCTPGSLTGRFSSNNLNNLKAISYNNASGEIRLVGRGTMISFR